MIYDAIIIGGGAAGLFCAITAGRRGKRVLVIEHNAEVGRKIIISGGGRCNFTNIHTTAENFVSANPHFAKSALARFTPHDFVSLVQKHKIPYYEKTLGQLFCRDNSRAIVDMLLDECRRAKAEILTSCSVSAVSRPDLWRVDTDRGPIESRQLVVACGGLSFPKIGASDLGYRIARQFGLKIEPTRPSLVALGSDGKDFSSNAGVSADARVTAGKAEFRENILFTHRGLSGPAILQASNYWTPNEPVSIDLLPEVDEQKLTALLKSSARVKDSLAGALPDRLMTAHLTAADLNRRGPELSDSRVSSIVTRLKDWKVTFTRTEGYDRAEVTLGGVSTAELSSGTLMAKKVDGLYFIGEVVDVTGWLGGFNFQWAWASGAAVGTAI